MRQGERRAGGLSYRAKLPQYVTNIARAILITASQERIQRVNDDQRERPLFGLALYSGENITGFTSTAGEMKDAV